MNTFSILASIGLAITFLFTLIKKVLKHIKIVIVSIVTIGINWVSKNIASIPVSIYIIIGLSVLAVLGIVFAIKIHKKRQYDY